MCGKKDDPPAESLPRLLLTTGSTIAGYRIKQTIGLVYGLTVRTRGIGGKFLASLRGLAGGEMGSFVKLAEE
ncbi:MAG: heavy metal-binding domain-containing protein, partial [Candidatus Ranarchaeia archaeon]